jgi:hypothetical protein
MQFPASIWQQICGVFVGRGVLVGVSVTVGVELGVAVTQFMLPTHT